MGKNETNNNYNKGVEQQKVKVKWNKKQKLKIS